MRYRATFLLGLGMASSLRVPTCTTRRQWLMRLATGGAVAAHVDAAHADPSFVSSLQGPLQDAIAPGHWIGQLMGINSKTERWEFANNSPKQVSAALVEVLNELTPERRSKLLIPEITIARADASKVHVLTWTQAEWLDSLDVSLEPRGGGCVATAAFYATGFLPTSIPLAPLANIAFAWFPFGSPGPRGEPLQDFRLRAIKGLLSKKLDSL